MERETINFGYMLEEISCNAVNNPISASYDTSSVKMVASNVIEYTCLRYWLNEVIFGVLGMMDDAMQS